MEYDFLEAENYIIALPKREKPLKIVCEDMYKIEATDSPMEFTLTKKITIGEAAICMDMSVVEFLEWVSKTH